MGRGQWSFLSSMLSGAEPETDCMSVCTCSCGEAIVLFVVRQRGVADKSMAMHHF